MQATGCHLINKTDVGLSFTQPNIYSDVVAKATLVRYYAIITATGQDAYALTRN